MTKNENDAIQYIIWRYANGLQVPLNGFTLQDQKLKWTPVRLDKLWEKFLDENKIQETKP